MRAGRSTGTKYRPSGSDSPLPPPLSPPLWDRSDLGRRATEELNIDEAILQLLKAGRRAGCFRSEKLLSASPGADIPCLTSKTVAESRHLWVLCRYTHPLCHFTRGGSKVLGDCGYSFTLEVLLICKRGAPRGGPGGGASRKPAYTHPNQTIHPRTRVRVVMEIRGVLREEQQHLDPFFTVPLCV